MRFIQVPRLESSMPQPQSKSLDAWFQAPTKPVEKAKAEAPTPATEPPKKERKRHAFPPKAPENLPASYFVSATYDGRAQKAVIKLYEPESGRIYFWYDNTGHKPYCFTNLSQDQLKKIYRLVNHEGFDHFEQEKK